MRIVSRSSSIHSPQARPLPQQRLVRDLDGRLTGDRVVVGHQQPVGAVLLDHLGRDAGELAGRGPAPEVVVVVAGGHQLGEEHADAALAVRIHLRVQLLGPAGERAADPAELLVRLRRHRRVLPTLVELGEGELQQRQRAGAADDLADHGADEAGLEAHAGRARPGPTIASCSSDGGHRRHRERRVADDPAEARGAGAAGRRGRPAA